ncbi:ExbD/TolR family protein [Cognatazoarcus halotolerans]|uniref:ExbD/TolR family protein n=1 Tax=Cognatazoarcus halotolerans TaxID=2686016 RepID=UPI0013585CDD|nr:biopolymer transporter ExbD [Cognatazoarcus halotolerans]MBX3679056.1 biopolymer transporter ExbD [Rhodocyclaceae bacterium]MCB1901451.1 biopolymer transporter ExbD [Rhodocyclaceae bacterium]MCP5308167.1 biopolymer transporter ExbD [Zoogloeaceae bacterium]
MAFGGFDQTSGNAPMSEINTTPLVDVMLVLLIIFMITAPLMTHAVKIDLPQASSTPAEDKPETITLSIDAEGRLFWNDAPLEAPALDQRLAEAAALEPQPELHLRADRDTRYQKLAELLAAARRNGLQRIGFITQPDPLP